MGFHGKVVIVTGASSGIGAATAIKFAQEGAQVCLVGRNQEKLNNVAKKCRKPLVLTAELTKDEDVKRIISETVKHFGRLDILINNAGIAPNVSIRDPNTMAIFEKVMATNLRAPVYLTSLAIPHLIETKGNIVNVSSIAAVHVICNAHYAYTASKAALDHSMRSIAAELAPIGVRVNNVNPGPVRTDIVANMGGSEEMVHAAMEMMKQWTTLGRASEPEEIADVILFLASDKAKAITGSSYVIDNGALLKYLNHLDNKHFAHV